MDKDEIYATLNRAYFSDEAHEKDVVAHLPVLLREAELVVDVGASLGQYTRAMVRALRHGEIHAIEADPVRAEQLKRNCEAWGRGSGNRVYAHHLALTEQSGTVNYFVTGSDVSGGLQPHATPRAVDWEEITIPSSTLDDLFPIKVPDFVKIDVEGAELQVLKGASRVLSAGPILLIELHDWDGSASSRDVRALLRSHGYYSAVFFGHPVFTTSRKLWMKLKAWAALRRIKQRITRARSRI